MNSDEKNFESETVYKLTDPNPQLWFLSTLFGLTGIILLIKLVLYSRKVSFLCEHDVWLNVLQILYIQIVVVYFNIATRIKMENTSWTYGMSTRTDFIFLTQEICIPRTTYLQNSQKVLSKFFVYSLQSNGQDFLGVKYLQNIHLYSLCVSCLGFKKTKSRKNCDRIIR